MNHVLAKIKGKNNGYEKLYSGESLFTLPETLESAVEYSPSTILEENEWYKIESLSTREYMIKILIGSFDSVNYDEAEKVRTHDIEYIVSVENEIYFFQRIMANSIFVRKRIILGDSVRLDHGERSIVINPSPDAIYCKELDVLYFQNLTKISPVFPGIEELYREATEEETKEFLENDFIKVTDNYGVNKIKKNNRQRIAMAMETLKGLDANQREQIIEYTHTYFPALLFDKKDRRFEIKSEEELKELLWGIEQRCFTTPITKEKRVANSIIRLK